MQQVTQYTLKITAGSHKVRPNLFQIIYDELQMHTDTMLDFWNYSTGATAQ